MNRLARLSLVPIAALVAACGGPPAGDAGALPRLRIAPHGLTVSGLSSGGYMATQVQVAHAREVAGAGIIAAGPWFCAQGLLARALEDCLAGGAAGPDVEPLVAIARSSALAKVIDDPASLADDRVWVFHGRRDDVVGAAVVDSLLRFYRAFVPPERIHYETQVAAGHGFPTGVTGGACGESAAPWLNDCGFDAAGQLLGFLYGDLKEPADAAGGELLTFRQSQYVEGGSAASMDARGFVFVPADCAAGEPCRLHVAFHGCGQGVGDVGRTFAAQAGYNRWAAANRIVVLYPQAARSRLMPFNPKGCWDWWGYTGPGYASRDGLQVRSVWRMVEALGGAG
jgi:poly(3-hydroxybutyrate) depolymerase